MNGTGSGVVCCERQPQHRYEDPLARVWIECAERLGFRIRRTGQAYVSYDGRGTIAIGRQELLDADDSLAQIILHELCHALVEGEDGRRGVDWGLDNTSERHVWREHACLRLQAHLAGTVGLRDFFAPTTDFRLTFWPELPDDPFFAPAARGGRREPSCVAARLGAWRASRYPWGDPLQQALAASALIAEATGPCLRAAAEVQPTPAGPEANGATREGLGSLWSAVSAPPSTHPAGHAVVSGYPTGQGCIDCAWSFTRRGRLRCRYAPKQALAPDAPACVRWESVEQLDCGDCGACCREAFHAVEVSSREAVNREHPELVISQGGRRQLRRDGERCAALAGGRAPTEAFHCTIYQSRPRTCRDFAAGSDNCLQARQRVGLSL